MLELRSPGLCYCKVLTIADLFSCQAPRMEPEAETLNTIAFEEANAQSESKLDSRNKNGLNFSQLTGVCVRNDPECIH